MKTLKYMLESSLLDIDGTFEKGDKYEKEIKEFFDEIDKHLKNVKLWNIKRPNLNKTEWVSFSFKVPMNETIFKLVENPLKLKQYKIEDLHIDIVVQWDHYKGEAKCFIELMVKSTFGSDIIVRYSGKKFEPNFNTNTPPDTLDDKIMTNKLLKPAIKNIFKPALNDIDTLIEFMTTNFD